MTGSALAWRETTTPRSSSDDRGPLVVTLVGELDVRGSWTLPLLLEDVAHGPPLTMVFDASRVTFLDAAGLSVLLVVVARLRAAGHTMRLHRPSSPVQRLLDLTGTADVLGLDPADLRGTDHELAEPLSLHT